MSDHSKVAQWRTAFAQKTDEELLFEKHHWVSHDERHIAADMELQARQQAAAERREAESRAQNEESMNQGRTLHRETQRVAWYAFWVGLGACLIAGLAFFHDLIPDFFHASRTRADATVEPSPAIPTPSVSPSPSPEIVPPET